MSSFKTNLLKNKPSISTNDSSRYARADSYSSINNLKSLNKTNLLRVNKKIACHDKNNSSMKIGNSISNEKEMTIRKPTLASSDRDGFNLSVREFDSRKLSKLPSSNDNLGSISSNSNQNNNHMKNVSDIQNIENFSQNSGYIYSNNCGTNNNRSNKIYDDKNNFSHSHSSNNFNNNKVNFTLPVYPIQREIRTITLPQNSNNYGMTFNNNRSNTIQNNNNNDYRENSLYCSSTLLDYKENREFTTKTLEQPTYKTIENSSRGRAKEKADMLRSRSFNDKDMFSYSSYHHKFNYKNNLRQYSFGFKESNYSRDDHITYKNKYFNNNFNKNYLIYPELEPIRLRSGYLRVDSKERIFPGSSSFSINAINRNNSNLNQDINNSSTKQVLNKSKEFNFLNKSNMRSIKENLNASMSKSQFGDKDREINDTKFNIHNIQSSTNMEFGTNRIKGFSIIKEPDFKSCIRIDVSII